MKRIMILELAGQMPMIRKVKELGYELAVIDYKSTGPSVFLMQINSTAQVRLMRLRS